MEMIINIDKNGEKSLEKIYDEIIQEINSKKYVINQYREKYLNHNIYSSYINSTKEKKDNIIIKPKELSNILDLFHQTINLSIKAIEYLLLKINSIKYLTTNSKFVSHTNSNTNSSQNSYPSISNTNIFKPYKGDNIKKDIENRHKLMKHSNRSYNHLLNNKNNLKYRLIIEDNNKGSKINETEILSNHSKEKKIKTNFNNYIKNLNKSNIYFLGKKNTSYSGKNDMLHKKYFKLDNSKNISNQRSEFIKINNFKLKIKSPIRQTLKEIVEKQKERSNKYKCSPINIIKKTDIKIKHYKLKNEDDIINEFLSLETKFNNYKIFFAEKYGDGDYNNFLKKYKNNKINKSIIENEYAILSKMLKYNSPGRYTEKIPINNIKKNYSNKNIIIKLDNNNKNKVKIKNLKKKYGFNTPKSNENHRKIIKDNFITKNNSINIIDNNIICVPQRYNTNNDNNKKYKPFISYIKKNNYIINSANKTFES